MTQLTIISLNVTIAFPIAWVKCSLLPVCPENVLSKKVQIMHESWQPKHLRQCLKKNATWRHSYSHVNFESRLLNTSWALEIKFSKNVVSPATPIHVIYLRLYSFHQNPPIQHFRCGSPNKQFMSEQHAKIWQRKCTLGVRVPPIEHCFHPIKQARNHKSQPLSMIEIISNIFPTTGCLTSHEYPINANMHT